MWRGRNTSPFFLPIFLARRVEVGSISQKEGYSIADTPMDSIFSADGACARSALTKNEGIVTPRTIFLLFPIRLVFSDRSEKRI